MPELLVICIGNASRGDDAAGALVAAQLEPQAARLGFTLIEDFQLTPEMVEDLRDHARAIIVDACLASSDPTRDEPQAIAATAAIVIESVATPDQPGAFTHATSPAQLLWLHRLRSPGHTLQMITAGITGTGFELGSDPAPTVVKTAHHLGRGILHLAASTSASMASGETSSLEAHLHAALAAMSPEPAHA